MTLSLDELKATIRDRFSPAPPNGWEIGWDDGRMFGAVANAASPCTCINYTSFDYEFCNHFRIECGTTPRGTSLVLTVRISYVLDVYSIHWIEYAQGGRIGRVSRSISDEAPKHLEEQVRTAIELAGFYRLPDEWLDEPIPGIALELAGPEGATVSKCLFQDYEG